VGAQFGSGFFTNMVLGRRSTRRTFSVDRDMKTADDMFCRHAQRDDPDLTRFAQRGGKLIIYHGWSDPAISAINSIDYYDSVVAKMGAKNAAAMLRLFMAPGLQHCSGGPGPSVFGQQSVSSGDREHDLAAALEAWVEHGTAPNHVIATRVQDRHESASGVLRTRPLCAYRKSPSGKARAARRRGELHVR